MNSNELMLTNMPDVNMLNEEIKPTYHNALHGYTTNAGGHVIATPLLLTRKWLLKCGMDPESESIELTGFNGLIIAEIGCKSIRLIDSVGNTLSKSYNYVHELQNLYYALTGEALKIKL